MNVSDEDEKGQSSHHQVYDVLIIGGGPAGLTAALYCKTHNLSVLVIEAKKNGGQLSQIYPTKFILNYASYPEIRAGYLADLMVHHAAYKNIEMRERETVLSMSKDHDVFIVQTEETRYTPHRSHQYHARSVIIAIGMGLFEPTRLNITGESEFEGKGVYYAVPNIEVFRGKSILVVGGGDTAVEDAVGLAGIAKVTLINRRDTFRATETNQDLLDMSPVKVLTPYVLKEIHGENAVRSAIIENSTTKEIEELPMDAVIINIGFAPDLSLLDNLGIEYEGNSIKIRQNHMHTNILGVFACGDIVSYAGKVKQIHPALGEASIAAEEAYKFLKAQRK